MLADTFQTLVDELHVLILKETFPMSGDRLPSQPITAFYKHVFTDVLAHEMFSDVSERPEH